MRGDPRRRTALAASALALVLIAGCTTPATPTPATPVTRTSTPSHPDIDYSRGYEHTVQAGETLWKIARDYNVTIQDIVNVNPSINNSSALSLGQKIFVPFRKQKDTQPQP